MSSDTGKPTRRKWITRSIAIGIALILASGGLTFYFKSCRGPKNKEEDRVEKVRRGRFMVKIRDTGNLEPLISVEVKSNVEGEIEKIYVKEGDWVEKGQVLMKIDDKQILEQKNQAEADVRAAQAQYDRARKNTEIAAARYESDLKQYEAALENAKVAYEATKTTSEQLISQAETEIRSTENALEQDMIQLRQAEIALAQAKITLAQNEAAAETAKSNLDNARIERDRMKELFEKKFVPKKSLEEAELRYVTAKSQYDSALKNVESQKKVIQSQEETIEARKKAIENRKETLAYQRENLEKLKRSRLAQEKQALINVQTAQERLDYLKRTMATEQEINRLAETTALSSLIRAQSYLANQQERLDWTTVTAPMSGIVAQLDVEEGEIIMSGRSAFASGPPIMVIADLSKMVVKVHVNEVDIGDVEVGQPAVIEVSSYPGKKFEGRVSEVAPSGQFRDNVIKFEVVVEVIGSPSELRPGMTADVDIITDDRDDVLQLPIEAVIDRNIMTVRSSLSSNDLAKFKVGDEIKVQTPMGKDYPAKVIAVYPDRTEENIEILTEEAGHGLQAGNYDLHLIKGDEKIEHVFSSVKAERKHFVMLKTPEDEKKSKEKKDDELKGKETYVKIGKRGENAIEILEGVKEGDEVYVPSISTLAKMMERKREQEKK